MRKIIFLFLISVVCCFLLNSCSQIPPGGESFQEDADPPAGYNPMFIGGLTTISEKYLKEASLYVSRIDVVKPDLVRLYMHLYNSEGILLTDAVKEPWSKAWCEVTDNVNDKFQKIDNYKLSEIPDQEIKPLSIALLMDHSGSIGEERANVIQNAAADLVRIKNSQDEIALIKYDNLSVVEQPFTTDTSLLLSKLNPIGLKGFGRKGSIAQSIFTAINLIKDVQNENRFIIIYTDGKDEFPENILDSILTNALEFGITICGIDFGKTIDENFLKQLSILSGGTYNHIYGTNEFQLIYKDIYRRLQHSYVIEYSPSEYGEHMVDIKFCLPQYEISSSTSYDNTPLDNIPFLLDIQFEFDQATIKNNSMHSIQMVCKYMTKFPSTTIEIKGHTDNAGDKNYNLKLSQQRAENVKLELIKCGISNERISAVGFGDTKPMANNNTKEGRAKNRRTEFIIIKSKQ